MLETINVAFHLMTPVGRFVIVLFHAYQQIAHHVAIILAAQVARVNFF